jgi:exonuclease VII large subunit
MIIYENFNTEIENTVLEVKSLWGNARPGFIEMSKENMKDLSLKLRNEVNNNINNNNNNNNNHNDNNNNNKNITSQNSLIKSTQYNTQNTIQTFLENLNKPMDHCYELIQNMNEKYNYERKEQIKDITDNIKIIKIKNIINRDDDVNIQNSVSFVLDLLVDYIVKVRTHVNICICIYICMMYI